MRASLLKRGKLYVFEGIDGAGKTTLAKALYNSLRKCSTGVHYFAFPGHDKGTLGRHVYKIHHDLKTAELHSLHATSLQLLHVAAHIDSIESRISPLLNVGHSIILDRYWWSAWAYGIAAGIDRKIVKNMIDLELFYWRGIKPAAVFLVSRKAKTTPKRETQANTLEEAYSDLATRERGKYPICLINNRSSLTSSLKSVLSFANHFA